MEDGITILYKADGRLVGSRSSKHNTVKVNELQFADDIAILAETKEKIVHAMSKLFEITSQWGLTISVPKTKVLVVGSTGEEEHALQIGDVQLEIVEEFKYLGSVIHHNGSIQSDTQGRVDVFTVYVLATLFTVYVLVTVCAFLQMLVMPFLKKIMARQKRYLHNNYGE